MREDTAMAAADEALASGLRAGFGRNRFNPCAGRIPVSQRIGFHGHVLDDFRLAGVPPTGSIAVGGNHG